MRFLMTIVLYFLLFSELSAQSLKVKDLSDNFELNYILSNIVINKITKESIYRSSYFIRLFIIDDSNATPENYFEGTDEVLESIIISLSPDGDYYSYSKLYKIEGILSPKIIEIKETNFPNFKIKIEYGPADKRKIETFEFEGIQ